MSTIDRILGESSDAPSDNVQAYRECQWAIAHDQRLIRAEPRIIKYPGMAYQYARDVIKGRWPEAEPNISTKPEWATYYAEDVIEGPWPEAEPHIAKDPEWAIMYAKDVLKKRFPLAEEAIFKSASRKYYLKAFPDAEDDWRMNGWLEGDWL